MAELVARTPLDGYAASFDGLTLREPPPRSIVAIAGSAPRAEAAFGTPLPALGCWTDTAFGGGGRLLGMQRDQWFVTFAPSAAPEADVRAALDGDSGDDSGDTSDGESGGGPADGPALTDQSDAWAALRIDGPNAVGALERTCRLDLHGEVLAPGRIARTSMDHVSVVIVREADARFLLLSPTSSAGSFLHAMITSARNATG